MPKKTPQDWETLERELCSAGADPAEVEAGSRRLLAEARGHQLAEARKQYGLAQRDVAARMGVSSVRATACRGVGSVFVSPVSWWMR